MKPFGCKYMRSRSAAQIYFASLPKTKKGRQSDLLNDDYLFLSEQLSNQVLHDLINDNSRSDIFNFTPGMIGSIYSRNKILCTESA
jgi:hypothetical protein